MNELISEFAEGQDKITIMLVDDHPLIRQALRNILEKQADFKIVAEASNGEEAVAIATKTTPNVVIMDIGMPYLNGLEATKQIKELCLDTAILVLTIYDDSEHILNILEAGAVGYLTKTAFEKEIVPAVRAVATGDAILSPEIMRRMIRHTARHFEKPVPLDAGERISSRELQILRMTALGLNNKDIAGELGLSLATIKGYLAEIYSKLNVGSRTEAVIVALRSGIITLDDLA